MDAGIVPMLVPPQPWVSVTEGGYLLTPGGWVVEEGAAGSMPMCSRVSECVSHACDLINPPVGRSPISVSSHVLQIAHTARIVRCQEDTYQHQLLMEQAENLGPVYDALDYVSGCPWKINSPVSIGPWSE